MHKNWCVKCDKQHLEGEETGKKEKKQRSVEASQLCLSETVVKQHRKQRSQHKDVVAPGIELGTSRTEGHVLIIVVPNGKQNLSHSLIHVTIPGRIFIDL